MQKNSKAQFYGYLFLYVDYYKAGNYAESTRKLLQADSIALATKNKNWQAAIFMRQAALSDVLNQDELITVNFYKKAIELCIETNDSLCIGESLEQLGSLYGYMEKYDSAHYFYERAIPILKKFADSVQIALTYNNYSILLSQEQKYAESIRNADSAIAITIANNDTYKQMMYENNRASTFAEMGNYDKAIEIYKHCLAINEKNKWADRLTKNYIGLFEAYEGKGNYRLAFEYLKTFYMFKDSLTGLEVQSQIAELNAKYEPQSKELELERQHLVLAEANQSLTKRTILLVTVLLVLLLGLIIWRLQSQKNKRELNQNKESLDELTNILLQKNTLLGELESKLVVREKIKIQSEKINDLEKNLYNERILTNTDWASFKIRFERAYPAYLVRLRASYPTLTEAEERLFIFIKLNLKSKEIASILGISADSVKKTRSRLRKRLTLAEEIDLDEFAQAF